MFHHALFVQYTLRDQPVLAVVNHYTYSTIIAELFLTIIQQPLVLYTDILFAILELVTIELMYQLPNRKSIGSTDISVSQWLVGSISQLTNASD